MPPRDMSAGTRMRRHHGGSRGRTGVSVAPWPKRSSTAATSFGCSRWSALPSPARARQLAVLRMVGLPLPAREVGGLDAATAQRNLARVDLHWDQLAGVAP